MWFSESGSAQSRSQSRPASGTSVGRGSARMSSSVPAASIVGSCSTARIAAPAHSAERHCVSVGHHLARRIGSGSGSNGSLRGGAGCEAMS